MKRVKLKTVITISAVVLLGLIISAALSSCGQPCPDGTEDTGVGRCVNKDEY